MSNVLLICDELLHHLQADGALDRRKLCDGLNEIRDARAPDANVEAVRKLLLERSQTGLRKYGVTTERDDLALLEWLQHLQDELLDAAVYVERLKHEQRI